VLIYAVALVGIIALVVLYRRDRSRLKNQRAQFFERCLDLFQSYRITQEGALFPSLAGTYRGHEVRLGPLIDDMAWRRVPVLWLGVTVLKPNRYKGILDLLIRPGAVEVFSPSAELGHHLRMPEGWPEQALLCTDDPDAVAPLESISPSLTLFADPYMKELVVTERGVRVLRMIAQARRLNYGVFREVRFEDDLRLDPAIATRLLDTAISIAESVHKAEPVDRAA
jgi:hypothetical protein